MSWRFMRTKDVFPRFGKLLLIFLVNARAQRTATLSNNKIFAKKMYGRGRKKWKTASHHNRRSPWHSSIIRLVGIDSVSSFGGPSLQMNATQKFRY